MVDGLSIELPKLSDARLKFLALHRRARQRRFNISEDAAFVTPHADDAGMIHSPHAVGEESTALAREVIASRKRIAEQEARLAALEGEAKLAAALASTSPPLCTLPARERLGRLVSVLDEALLRDDLAEQELDRLLDAVSAVNAAQHIVRTREAKSRKGAKR